jgi:hypothetical protein
MTTHPTSQDLTIEIDGDDEAIVAQAIAADIASIDFSGGRLTGCLSEARRSLEAIIRAGATAGLRTAAESIAAGIAEARQDELERIGRERLRLDGWHDCPACGGDEGCGACSKGLVR